MIRKTLYRVIVWTLTLCARVSLKLHDPTVIAITGSVGKTTTKDLILAQLQAAGVDARGTIRSQNSDISTPLSVLGIELYNNERRVWVWLVLMVRACKRTLCNALPQYLVLEVGAGHPGDIPAIARWLRPDVVVYTALAQNPVHVEFFDSREALFQEKRELARLSHKHAHVVYPADDAFLPDVLADVERTLIPVDMDNIQDVSYNKEGTSARIDGVVVTLPGVWSSTLLRSYLLGLALLREQGLDVAQVHQNFAQHFTPAPGRNRLLAGIRNTQVVDDSYNASPKAVSALLAVMDQLAVSGKKIFVFGDMKELGEYTVSAHEEVGREAARVCDVLVLVGKDILDTQRAAIESGMDAQAVLVYDDADKAGEYLEEFVREGDLVVAKSSRHAIKMERCLRHIVVPEELQYLNQEYIQG